MPTNTEEILSNWPVQMGEWTEVRPDKPCLFVAATWMKTYWLYEIWELDMSGTSKSLLNNRGQWKGIDVEQLNADKYMIIQKLDDIGE
jgi:hypothetical protein